MKSSNYAKLFHGISLSKRGAERSGLPSAVRGTPYVGRLAHCAASEKLIKHRITATFCN
jgi:hypothetical protein